MKENILNVLAKPPEPLVDTNFLHLNIQRLLNGLRKEIDEQQLIVVSEELTEEDRTVNNKIFTQVFDKAIIDSSFLNRERGNYSFVD